MQVEIHPSLEILEFFLVGENMENQCFQVPFVQNFREMYICYRVGWRIKSRKQNQVDRNKPPDETPGCILFDLFGLCDLLVCALLLLGPLCKFGDLQYLSKLQTDWMVSPKLI